MTVCTCIAHFTFTLSSIPTPGAEVSNIVTIVVPVAVVITVMVLAVLVIVSLTALQCRKWRKKTTAPVGGTQDQGK